MTKATIVLATRNAGKVSELADALRAYGLDVLGLDAFPQVGEIEETGTTFEENALLKARAVAEATGHVAVADDSGLEVDALERRPGVYSARYSDDTPDLPGDTRDARNNAKLLLELDGVPAERRTARFRCVMAACTPDGRHVFAEGAWEGHIALAPEGAGVGDAVFLYDVQGPPQPLDAFVKAMVVRRAEHVEARRPDGVAEAVGDAVMVGLFPIVPPAEAGFHVSYDEIGGRKHPLRPEHPGIVVLSAFFRRLEQRSVAGDVACIRESNHAFTSFLPLSDTGCG